MLLRLGENLLATLLDLLDVALILGDGLLHILLTLMDALSLVLPVSLVSHDVLQVLVALDVLGTDDVGSLLDDFLRQSYLAGDLDGKRRTGATDGELEECLHLVAVIEHCSVCHALMTVGEVLQVLVVGGDDTVCPLLAESVEHCLGDGSTDARLRTRTKLIDEDDGVAVGCLHHVLHVEQVGGVGTQVVLQALFVADVYHNVLEDAGLRTLAHRDAESALEHVLQETHGLQTDRLTAGVRTGDDEDALVLCEGDIERYHLLALLLQ